MLISVTARKVHRQSAPGSDAVGPQVHCEGWAHPCSSLVGYSRNSNWAVARQVERGSFAWPLNLARLSSKREG